MIVPLFSIENGMTILPGDESKMIEDYRQRLLTEQEEDREDMQAILRETLRLLEASLGISPEPSEKVIAMDMISSTARKGPEAQPIMLTSYAISTTTLFVAKGNRLPMK
jgi:hypothetical protein